MVLLISTDWFDSSSDNVQKDLQFHIDRDTRGDIGRWKG